MKRQQIVLLAVLLILAGCGGSRPVVHQFFLLETPPGKAFEWPDNLHAIAGSCEVENVRVAPPYASHQIAVREDSHQLRFFTFNEWAVRPDQQLTQIVIDFFEEHHVFGSVMHGRIAERTDYVVETNVVHMELDNRQDDFHARLHVEFKLISLADVDPVGVVHHVANRSEPLNEKNINEFAATVSRLFMDELHAFSTAFLNQAGDEQ